MADDPGDVIVITSVTTRLKAAGDTGKIYQRIYDFHHALAVDFSGTAPPAPRKVRVKAGVANVRSGPSTTFAILGQARREDALVWKADQDGWTQTNRGWINSSLLENVA